MAAAVAGKAALSPQVRGGCGARERGKHGCTKYDTCRILARGFVHDTQIPYCDLLLRHPTAGVSTPITWASL